jgi:hypothetical protein
MLTLKLQAKLARAKIVRNANKYFMGTLLLGRYTLKESMSCNIAPPLNFVKEFGGQCTRSEAEW